MELTKDNVYGAIERQLRDENFNVKHLMRDFRGDWGDDGGYLVSISEKNGKVYLHIIAVNYNVSIDSNVLDENYHSILDGSQKETDIQDYIICESIEDAQTKVNEFVDRLKQVVALIEEDDNYFFESGYINDEEEVPPGFEGLEKYYLNMLASCWFSFSEYTQKDEPILLSLTKTEYVPDYTDPEEYMD